MQNLWDLCDLYATNHQLSYSATKSIGFKSNRIKIKPLNFALGVKVIRSVTVDQCKYVGRYASSHQCKK